MGLETRPNRVTWLDQSQDTCLASQKGMTNPTQAHRHTCTRADTLRDAHTWTHMHTDTHTHRQDLGLQPLTDLPGTSSLNLTRVRAGSAGGQGCGESPHWCACGERGQRSRGHRKVAFVASATVSRPSSGTSAPEEEKLQSMRTAGAQGRSRRGLQRAGHASPPSRGG